MDGMGNGAEDRKLTFRRYRDGDDRHLPWQEEIFIADESHKCPTYVHRTPPCQGSCPSGEDIRGWLNIARGIDKPVGDMAWQEYAFRRITDANPFPAIMGRVCPAPCEDGCNRNEVEDHVGINAVEQYIGDWALENGLTFDAPAQESGNRIAIIGGGPAGLACAYQLRRKGHACTVFDERAELGGMMRYGIPGYRTPRAVLDGEIKRIIDMGVEVRLNTKVGVDMGLAEVEEEFDAVFVGLGAQSGQPLPVPGAEAPNCVSGIAFLLAFNEGRLRHVGNRVLVVGGGDTAMDVASVARRLGHITQVHAKDRPENAIAGQVAHDVASVAARQGANVLLVYRRPLERMPAARHEVEAAAQEGVEMIGNLAPVAVVVGDDGRATALRVIETDWSSGKMEVKQGSERDIECDLIVSAVGQAGDFTGMAHLDNGQGLVTPDRFYRVPDNEGFYVGGDIIRPHLLTTAIGHAAIAVDSIEHQLAGDALGRRPKVDVHHFSLLHELRRRHQAPETYGHTPEWGTDAAAFAIHNYEDCAAAEIIPSDKLYLGHFGYNPRHRRGEIEIGPEEVLGHFEERIEGFDEMTAQAEAGRCMSCGMCFECNNCVVYCPQIAVHRTKKSEAAHGRYVYTDYSRCIGCHICADVCPSGYIQMGLGE